MALRRKRGADEVAAATDPARPTADGRPRLRPTLGELGGPPMNAEDEKAKAARYNDWAERMRDKRMRAQEQARLIHDRTAPPSYWNSDALYEESRRLDHEELHERPNPWRVSELLAVLDLRDGASPHDIGDAYRKLAKVHHPDRFVEADEEVRAFHEQKMRAIIDAYATLKTLEKTSG